MQSILVLKTLKCIKNSILIKHSIYIRLELTIQINTSSTTEYILMV